MHWSIRSVLIWMIIAAVLSAVAIRLWAFSAFLLTFLIPAAYLLHIRVPESNLRRISYASCFFISLIPMYIASLGPVTFLQTIYLLRPEKESEWVETIDKSFFALANSVNSKIPNSIFEFPVPNYRGEWFLYGTWYLNSRRRVRSTSLPQKAISS